MALKRYLYLGAAAIAFAGLFGCAGGSKQLEDDGGDGGSTSTGQMTRDYRYRQQVTIDGVVEEGYSIPVTIDHAGLVAAEKALPTGDDVRVFFVVGSDAIEIDRMLDPSSAWEMADTTIWFATQPDMDGSGQYFIYYGSPDAGAAPDDGSKVFMVWDHFEGTGAPVDFVVDSIGNDTGLALVNQNSDGDSVVRITGETGAVGSVADNFVFMHREVSGSFTADAKIAKVGGNRGAESKLGGLMIRQGTAEDARNICMSIKENPKERVSSIRASDAGDTTAVSFAGGDPFPQWVAIQRQGVSVAPQYSEDGKTWIGLGSPGSITFQDPVQIGIPFANVSAGDGWVEMDWIRVRKLALPEPIISMGSEESI